MVNQPWKHRKAGREQSLRSRVLREQGVRIEGSGLRPKVVTDNSEPKTPQMKLLEQEFEAPIEDLIRFGPVRDIAHKLGVTPGAVSRWRKRFGLRQAAQEFRLKRMGA